jgi:hypothetical protein
MTPRRKSPPRKPRKVLCFDVETESFTESFRNAYTSGARTLLAPKMRIACAFDGRTWYYFLPSEAAGLIALASNADELITFNGLAFDELVLRRHHGLLGRFPIKGKHADLCEEIRVRHGLAVSLDRLARLNLGEKKHTAGRSMSDLDIDALKLACRSDVWQTYRLWELWRSDKLQIPPPATPRERGADIDISGPGHHMPTLCPHCHSANSLEFIDDDPDEMSEGQLADYMAGTFGAAGCHACGHQFDWEL